MNNSMQWLTQYENMSNVLYNSIFVDDDDFEASAIILSSN